MKQITTITKKNYLPKLKAEVEKRMRSAGVWDLILKGAEHSDEFETTIDRFFASLNDFPHLVVEDQQNRATQRA